jgi:Uri superfamily endonuclease
MVRDPEVVVRLRRLQAEISIEISALKAREQETRELASRWDADGRLGRPELVLVAVNLHGWYTALESGLERVARLLDQSLPSGASWHIDLIEQMRLDMPGLRPALLETASVGALHELRKFRHFFRNAYVLELDPAKVRARVDDLMSVAPSVMAGLDRFERELARAIAEMVEASRTD